jgi:sporulation protein YlmC with PRC-barrel domain
MSDETLPFEKTVEAKKIVGKKVITDKGKNVGKVKAIHIHPTELTVEGIVVDPGMLELDHYIDKTYIRSLNAEGAVLNITPITEVVGLKVYDAVGRKIGKVAEIRRSDFKNTIRSIMVDTGADEDGLVIPVDYIATIGDAVMLKEKISN